MSNLFSAFPQFSLFLKASSMSICNYSNQKNINKPVQIQLCPLKPRRQKLYYGVEIEKMKGGILRAPSTAWQVSTFQESLSGRSTSGQAGDSNLPQKAWTLLSERELRALNSLVYSWVQFNLKRLYHLFKFYLFIYSWLCWVFVSVRGLSLVAASGGHSSSRCAGLSLSRPLLLWSTGSRRAGSVVVAHGPSCSAACGIFPDQGSNPCPLHWQADSQPLHHQGSPRLYHLKLKKNTHEMYLSQVSLSLGRLGWSKERMMIKETAGQEGK